MDKQSNYPTLWDSKPNGSTANKTDMQQTFLEKAFIENFFDKHLATAKHALQAENLLYDKIKCLSAIFQIFISDVCYLIVTTLDTCYY